MAQAGEVALKRVRNFRYILKAELARCTEELDRGQVEEKDEGRYFKPDDSLLWKTILRIIDVSSIYPLVVTSKNISRHCQISP